MALDQDNRAYLLVFVTTSCQVCGPVWAMLAAWADEGPSLPAPVVVVTPSAAMEDSAAAHRLTPARARLHMSSDTWFMYGVAQAGTVLLVSQGPGAPVPWEEPGPVLGSTVLGSTVLGNTVLGERVTGQGTAPATVAALAALARRWLRGALSGGSQQGDGSQEGGGAA